MRYAHAKREGAVRGHPCVLDRAQVELARKWKSENAPQDIIGFRLGCAMSVVSRAVRGIGNYGKIAPLSSGAALAQEPRPCAPGHGAVPLEERT